MQDNNDKTIMTKEPISKYNSDKNSKDNIVSMDSKRRKRINKIKTAIIITIIFLILLPTLFCIYLGLQVNRLQKQVDKLVAIHNQYQISENDSTLAYGAVRDENSAPDKDNSQSDVNTDTSLISDESKGNSNDGTGKNAGIYAKKKVYLTFDDGPSIYTNQILDILDAYHVKATFFVIGKTDKKSKAIYKRIVEDGHTLGMHSYSHNYNLIYKSVEDFDKDFTKLWNLLYDTTGYKPNIYRFPGGSDNLVNDHGMGDFIQYLNQSHIVYFDWNVVNGDATYINYTKKQLVKNVLNGVATRDNAVVLMHDTQMKKTTVESLQELLDTLISGGAQILPLNEKVSPIQMIKADTK